jgi:hypothetical protein
MTATAAGDNRDLRSREGSDATTGNAFPPNALGNALSRLGFHSIAAIFIFGSERGKT